MRKMTTRKMKTTAGKRTRTLKTTRKMEAIRYVPPRHVLCLSQRGQAFEPCLVPLRMPGDSPLAKLLSAKCKANSAEITDAVDGSWERMNKENTPSRRKT